MSQTVVRLVIDIITIFFVTYSLSIFQEKSYEVQDFYICVLLYVPGYFLLEEYEWTTYIIKNIYLLLTLAIYFFRCRANVKNYMALICMLLGVCEIYKTLAGIISGLSRLFVPIIILSEETVVRLILIFVMCIMVCISIHILKTGMVNLELSFSKKCMAYFIYILVICSKIPFLYTDITENKVVKAMIIATICCTVIFLIISKIERHNAEMERAKIEENNKNLSTKLHKTQEILPAMVHVLSNVAENSGKEMEEKETQKLLSEVTDLFGNQLKENSKEDLQLKNFCSTGLTLLDQQLRVYQMEAVDRNVNLDIFVQAPINGIIKKDSIDQLKLQRALGDLVRNAFRVEEREDKKCRANKHILLIIGCRYEDILEIAVVDNGENFPLHVIEAFGRRGVTTGGTGNGLADLVEFADEARASIYVEEFAWETNSFTKKVSIIFDKKRTNYFDSPRKELINSSFWNKIEY